MKSVLQALRSPAARTTFILLAIGAALWAVISEWDTFVSALSALSWWQIALALASSVLHVFMTMLAWRAMLNSSGPPVGFKVASGIFFTSQVAKYLPGGVWNFVAAAEAGVQHAISRRRSLTVLITWMLMSVLTGSLLSLAPIALDPENLLSDYWGALLLVPVLLVFLSPPVLNRAVNTGLRVLRREGMDSPFTWSGLTISLLWSLAAWAFAGIQVWLILTAAGMDASVSTYALATCGYALAWVIGFLVFFAPVGLGVREVVLGAVLLGYDLDAGQILTVILLSRLLFTVADIVLGVGASLTTASPARSATTATLKSGE